MSLSVFPLIAVLLLLLGRAGRRQELRTRERRHLYLRPDPEGRESVYCIVPDDGDWP